MQSTEGDFTWDPFGKGQDGVKVWKVAGGRTRNPAVCTPPRRLCRPIGRRRQIPTCPRGTPPRDPQSPPRPQPVAAEGRCLREDGEVHEVNQHPGTESLFPALLGTNMSPNTWILLQHGCLWLGLFSPTMLHDAAAQSQLKLCKKARVSPFVTLSLLLQMSGNMEEIPAVPVKILYETEAFFLPLSISCRWGWTPDTTKQILFSRVLPKTDEFEPHSFRAVVIYQGPQCSLGHLRRPAGAKTDKKTVWVLLDWGHTGVFELILLHVAPLTLQEHIDTINELPKD